MKKHPAHIHVLTSIEREASGPTYSVRRLAEAQAALGLDVAVYSLAERTQEQTRNGVVYRSYARSGDNIPGIARLEASRTLAKALDAAAAQGSLLHAHGLWRMPNVYPGRAARRHNVPLVLSPRGMLGAAALDYSAMQKRLFWHIAQSGAVAPVRCYHATSQAELEDIRKFGLTAPVGILPNGIDLPDLNGSVLRAKQVLHLGRIHPKKGIDRLLYAWARVAEEHSDWQLRIVGPSERGHVDELQRLVGRLGLGSCICFDGPLYGAEKQAAYRQASLFVLATRHENFGMVVAEALANSTPVICTTGAPWDGLLREGCGWWVDQSPEAIATALLDGMTRTPGQLAEMGSRGRDWMRRDFGWDGVAKKMLEVYRWVTLGGEVPECVTV